MKKRFFIFFFLAFFAIRVNPGANWVLRSPAGSTGISNAARGADCFVAIGGTNVFRSATGARWEQLPGFSVGPFWGIGWDGNRFLAASGRQIFASANGIDWTAVASLNSPDLQDHQFEAMTSGNGVCLIIARKPAPNLGRGSVAVLLSSHDLTNWNSFLVATELYVTTFGWLRFEWGRFWLPTETQFSSDFGGATAMYSSADGITWTGDSLQHIPMPGPVPVDIHGTDAAYIPPEVIATDRDWSLRLSINKFTDARLRNPDTMELFTPYVPADPDWQLNQTFGFVSFMRSAPAFGAYLLFSDGIVFRMTPTFFAQPPQAIVERQSAPPGLWTRAIRWQVGITEKTDSFIALNNEGAIMQNTFDIAFFAEAPRFTQGNDTVLLTVNLPPNTALDLVGTDDFKTETLLHHFDATEGRIEQIEVANGAAQTFFKLKTPP